MSGLGDNIYQRPVVAHLAARHSVFLRTPWPQLYGDLDIRFLRPPRGLRCQDRNVDDWNGGLWSEPPESAPSLRLHYGACWTTGRSILEALANQAGMKVEPKLQLPEFDGPSSVRLERPYAVVRPVTLRRDWPNRARNCLPQYVAHAARSLRQAGYMTVLVGDCADGQEWALPPVPEADLVFMQGELDVLDLVALCRGASAAVGPVGWLLPMAMAVDLPLLCVLGGQGGPNDPSVLVPAGQGRSVRFAKPDRFCRCSDRSHDCDKTISGFGALLSYWIDSLEERRDARARNEPDGYPLAAGRA